MAELAAKNAGERVDIDIAAEAPLAPAAPTPIDRAHLARMTHGERASNTRYCSSTRPRPIFCLGGWDRSPSSAVAALAHTLNGSSRGVGAWQVADAAAAVEADVAEGRDTAPSVKRLASAIRAVQVDIVALMRG